MINNLKATVTIKNNNNSSSIRPIALEYLTDEHCACRPCFSQYFVYQLDQHMEFQIETQFVLLKCFTCFFL